MKNLQALVLDEADALLQPLGRYSTAREKSAREAHPKEAASLLRLLCAARGNALQLFAASATVGRPLRRELASLSGRKLELIRSPGAAASAEPVSNAVLDTGATEIPDLAPLRAAAAEPGGPIGSASGRAVGLPAGVSVSVLTCDDDNMIAAIHHTLGAEAAEHPLLFLPPGRSLGTELKLLRQCELDAVSLADILAAARATPNGLDPGAAITRDGGNRPRLIVATASEVRGIDLPEVDLVLVMGVPPTADHFIHLAGRTGRRGRPGRVVLLATEQDAARRLGALGAQLGLNFGREQSHLAQRNEQWAEMWRVHQKIVQAERKGY